MKRTFCLILTLSFLILFLPLNSFSQDINDLAYENRIHLKAGTIWNLEGKGDCLIFPYFDVRKVGNSTQVTSITIENTGDYGIVAKLRFRDWQRGAEIFSRDIWIPSAGTWSATVQSNEEGTNAIIYSWGDVIFRADGNAFYFTNDLINGASFSKKYLWRKGSNLNLYGFLEVIGEEKTSPTNVGGKVNRLSPSERDCPNTLKGSLTITRVEEGAVMGYDAVAIGNFSRGQGSLFRFQGSQYPRLDQCEDTLDQIDFQLSKWEIFGPFSISPSNQGRASLIVTFPTKHFHYDRLGRRVNKINNPFKALRENQDEDILTTLSSEAPPFSIDSRMSLPYSVNVVGLYREEPETLSGVDNLFLPTFSYETGVVKLTSENMATRLMINDYEYFRELFTAYRGLPAIAMILQEYRNPSTLHTTLTHAEFSSVWETSSLESILFPTFVNGPTFGQVNEEYTFTTGGASSNIDHPIQYEFDWGDGTTSGWLGVGVTSANKKWTSGGAYAVKSRARCALHPNIVSRWSNQIVVVIESVSSPTTLNGSTTGLPGVSYTYFTGGSVSNMGHPVQYLFEWGDETDSNWLPVGVTSATKFWPKGGTYSVRARARCALDTQVMSEWTPSLTVKIELISTPSAPVGETKGVPGVSYTYMTGGATSNIGDPVEYQFDWGDGTFSGWQSSTSASKSWSTGGTYLVRARARCAIHPSIMSDWSTALSVNIEKVSTPSTPTQSPSGVGGVGQTFTYSTGGATSNVGHPVQYLFDWGDGSNSGWLPPGVTSAQKTWYYAGEFKVKAKARCAEHPFIESDWSPELKVEIESISTPEAPTGDENLNVSEQGTYTTGGATSNLGHTVQYQFDWGDGTSSSWGETSATKTWNSAGTYNVRARARCQTHTTIVSDWSEPLVVTVSSP